jgi:hypothetical protein
MKHLENTLTFIAFKLAEKPVKLRFKHNSGVYGLCRADSSGLVTIDIEPELQNYEKKFLEIFLHEVAHAKNDKFIPMELELSDSIPLTKDTDFEHRETTAEKQAEEWLQYAETHRKTNLDYLTGCLLTLLEL